MKISTRAKTINIIDKSLTAAIFILYPSMMVYIFASGINVLPYIVVPGVAFVAVSLFRSFYNAPRPYDKPGASDPLLKREGSGKSFPSRHVFSTFIIAVTAFRIWPTVGLMVGAAGILIAWTRVAGGVHFPRDVIAGAAAGVLLGIIGYVVMPL